jgi:hypothetical protein
MSFLEIVLMLAVLTAGIALVISGHRTQKTS